MTRAADTIRRALDVTSALILGCTLLGGLAVIGAGMLAFRVVNKVERVVRS